MEWREEGVVLALRRHGETAAIIDVFTRDHGRHSGIVRGGASRKLAPILQPGAQLALTWRARLEDHLGSFAVEPVRSRAALVMDDRFALAGLNAICALLQFCLAERDPHPELYTRTLFVLDRLDQPEIWPLAYLHWEMTLLEELGFGLDLSACAVTGVTQDLIYVSPKSGRAVSEAGAGAYAARLLPLPPAMRGFADDTDLPEAFRTTGHFLAFRVAPSLGDRPVPAARQRLMELLSKRAD